MIILGNHSELWLYELPSERFFVTPRFMTLANGNITAFARRNCQVAVVVVVADRDDHGASAPRGSSKARSGKLNSQRQEPAN
jgi:hypothetical protein